MRLASTASPKWIALKEVLVDAQPDGKVLLRMDSASIIVDGYSVDWLNHRIHAQNVGWQLMMDLTMDNICFSQLIGDG